MLGNTKAEGRGAVYLRVSTTAQDFIAQKGSVGVWAERQKNLKLKLEYKEKISGSGGYVRKELNAMLADARANQFDVAIFNDMSRLGRNVYEAIKVVHEFADAGVAVAICEIDMVWDLKDPVCNMVAGVLMTVAQFESDEGKKRTRRGMTAKAKQIEAYIKTGKLPEGARVGMAGIVEKYIDDPSWSSDGVRKHKKGLLVQPDPSARALFELIWNDEDNHDAYRTISSMLRIPRNPKCNYKCKEHDGIVVKVATAKCYCGKRPSRKTVHKTRVALGLPVRNVHSFKRSTVKEADHEILIADYLSAVSEA